MLDLFFSTMCHRYLTKAAERGDMSLTETNEEHASQVLGFGVLSIKFSGLSSVCWGLGSGVLELLGCDGTPKGRHIVLLVVT